MVVTVSLAWPDSRLSPNARVFHMVLHQLKKDAKSAAYWAVHDQTNDRARAAVAAIEGKIEVNFTFHPPDRRARDTDNCIAAMKAAQDGLALALGVDDNRFVPTYRMAGPEKPGRVEVTFPQASQAAPVRPSADAVVEVERPGQGVSAPAGPDQDAKGPHNGS